MQRIVLCLAFFVLLNFSTCDDASKIAELATMFKQASSAAAAVQPVLQHEKTVAILGTEQDVGFDSIHTRSSVEKGEVLLERAEWLAGKVLGSVPASYARAFLDTWSKQAEGADFLNITSLLIFDNGKGGMEIVDIRVAPTAKNTIRYAIATITAKFSIPPKCTLIKTTKKSFLKSKDTIHRDCRDATITALHIKQLSDMTYEQINYFSSVLAQLTA